jgi:hypothetical protein
MPPVAGVPRSNRSEKVIEMLATIALTGTLVLFALATIIGLIDSRSQRSAWNRIAAARKEIFEDRRVIDELTVALQVREDQLELREQAVRGREEAVAGREQRLPPKDDGPEGVPAA